MTIMFLDADQVRARVSMPDLIERLRAAFAQGDTTTPRRQIVSVPGGSGDRLLLAMPAFAADGAGAIKIVTFFPDNVRRSVPTIQGAILVLSNEGRPVACIDAAAVTQLRTAAASGLASSYLSRADSRHLLIVGTGALAPYMALAHAAVRPLNRVSVWGRDAARASATVAQMQRLISSSIEVHAARDLPTEARAADIISCATSSTQPVLRGEWVKAGTFVDLVGSFSPDKREADDDVVRRARIFVDTFEGVMSEAGDILDPLARGVIARQQVEAELADLASGRKAGRSNDEEITLFKSVGTALEDLVGAQCALAR